MEYCFGSSHSSKRKMFLIIVFARFGFSTLTTSEYDFKFELTLLGASPPAHLEFNECDLGIRNIQAQQA